MALWLMLAAACSGGGGGGGGRGPIVLPNTPSQLVEPPRFSPGPPPVDAGDSTSGGEHPSLFLNQNEIDDLLVSAMSGEEPARTQLTTTVARARGASSPDPEVPSEVYQGTNHKAFRAAFDPDTTAMLNTAIAAQFPAFLAAGERDQMLSKARDFLVSWARYAFPGVTSIDQLCVSNECLRFETGLSISVGLLAYVSAYDLVFDTGALSESDHAEIRAFLEKLYDLVREGTFIWGGGPGAGGPAFCHRFSNHATRHIAGMASIGYILDDEAKVQEALFSTALRYSWSTLLRDSLYVQGDGILGCDPPGRPAPVTGETYDRYRHFDVPGVSNDPLADPESFNNSNLGYGYSILTVFNLSWVAEMALHRGRDLYRTEAASGESLMLPAAYYAFYKAFLGPGANVIVPSGFPGEENYTGEIMRDGYNETFEPLAHRYHQHADIVRALEPYDQLAIPRRFFNPLFFGRFFDPERLEWDFHLSRVSEGWELVEQFQVAEAGVSGGALWFESRMWQPAIRNSSLQLAATSFSDFVLTMRVSPVGAMPPLPMAQLSWRTESGSQQSTIFMFERDGALREYRIPLSVFSTWSTPGSRIVEISLRVNVAPGDLIEIESIRLDRVP